MLELVTGGSLRRPTTGNGGTFRGLFLFRERNFPKISSVFRPPPRNRTFSSFSSVSFGSLRRQPLPEHLSVLRVSFRPRKDLESPGESVRGRRYRQNVRTIEELAKRGKYCEKATEWKSDGDKERGRERVRMSKRERVKISERERNLVNKRVSRES